MVQNGPAEFPVQLDGHPGTASDVPVESYPVPVANVLGALRREEVPAAARASSLPWHAMAVAAAAACAVFAIMAHDQRAGAATPLF